MEISGYKMSRGNRLAIYPNKKSFRDIEIKSKDLSFLYVNPV
jgi:hypothetical protein